MRMGIRENGLNIPPIGEKLRAARLQQGLSLRELAEKAFVSPSLLSKVENGKANPSVRSLHSIAEALSVPVHHFFPEEEKAPTESAAASTETISGARQALTASELRAAEADGLVNRADLDFTVAGRPRQEPVIRAKTRPTIELLGGVTWSRLTPGPEEGVELLQICYEAGASSGKQMSHHAGREFQYVLEGELLLELGFERYVLQAGDSIIFDSETPHRLSNTGQVPLHAITLIFQPQIKL